MSALAAVAASGAGVAALALLAQTARISVPYVLAALGGTWSERSGVINIALEGLLLAGAFGAAWGTLATGSPGLGLLCGVLAGVALAGLYGLSVLRLRADPIVAGVAVTLLASGLTRFLLKALYGSASNSPRIDAPAALWPAARAAAADGGGAAAAVAGLASPLIWLAVLAVAASHLALRRTRFGLRLRAAGEHPGALASVGVAVRPLRWAAVLLSGALAGLGGTWLAFDQHKFVAGMAAGRGYIALAAMILGGWSPLGATGACLLFGLAEAVELRLQLTALSGSWVVAALPYLLTIAALALRGARRPPPAALAGAPWRS